MGCTHRFALIASLAGAALVLLATIVAAVAPAGSGQLLVRIDTTDRATLAAIHRYLQPVRIIEGLAVAWGDSGSVAAARRAGAPVEILATRRTDRAYAVVYLPAEGAGGRPEPAAAGRRLAELGRPLWSDARRAILEYAPVSGEALCSAFEILPILDRPVVLRELPGKAVSGELPPLPETPDPVVQGYADAVNADSLLSVVAYLQDLGSRRSPERQCFAAADSLTGMLRRHGVSDVSRFIYTSVWPGDVVGVQRGIASPDELYIICGHYDSISNATNAPGADDNGTGTAAVIEAARILGRQQFEATIVYLAVSGEEEGLVGSEAWARWATSRNMDIRGVINLDMVGWRQPDDPPDLDVISNDESTDLNDFVFGAGAMYLPEYSIIGGFYAAGNSDQQSFWDAGYPAVTFFEDTDTHNPTYHTANDRIGPSVNDPGFFRQNVRVAVAALASLARPVAVHVYHEPLPDPPATAASYLVQVRIVSPAPLAPDGARLQFRVNGGAFSAVALRRSGNPDSYAAEIPRQEPGDLVEYYVEARDTGGRRSTEPANAPGVLHSFMVGRAVAFYDTFVSDEGWTVGAPGDAAVSGVWVRANPVGTRAQPETDADGDSLCYVTGNGEPGGAAGDADVDGGRTTLTSPRLDLNRATTADLTFSCWFFNEAFPDDSLDVLLSNDDGASWSRLQSVHESKPEWRLISQTHLENAMPLTGEMRLRFSVADLGRPSLLEAGIDAVKVRAVILPPPPPPTTTALLVPSPQPFRTSVTIGYDLSRAAPVDLAVFDAGGRRIAELVHAPRGVDRYRLSWDGRGPDRRPVPSGVYFLRLETGDNVYTRRVVRVR